MKTRHIFNVSVKSRKVTISFVISLSPSNWNNSAPAERIFMKFDIRVVFENQSRKLSLKFDKNKGYFT
jgi:hypothetical protein